MNCWEYKQCGREKGGVNEKKIGQCPVYPDYGKHCARIAGTFCGGRAQGTFALELESCLKCDFYQSKYYDHSYNKFQVINY